MSSLTRVSGSELCTELCVNPSTPFGKRLMRLAPTGACLLKLLVDARGAVVSRECILASIGRAAGHHDLRTVDTWVRRLRSALIRGRGPNPIVSVRGEGYFFDPGAFELMAKDTGAVSRKVRLAPKAVPRVPANGARPQPRTGHVGPRAGWRSTPEQSV